MPSERFRCQLLTQRLTLLPAASYQCLTFSGGYVGPMEMLCVCVPAEEKQLS